MSPKLSTPLGDKKSISFSFFYTYFCLTCTQTGVTILFLGVGGSTPPPDRGHVKNLDALPYNIYNLPSEYTYMKKLLIYFDIPIPVISAIRVSLCNLVF